MSGAAIGIKAGARILAVACGPIRGRTVLTVGVVGRRGAVEGVLSSRISVDGTDATRKIIGMLSGSRFSGQVRLIAVNGVALAGLNVIDVNRLERELGARVLILTRERPVTSRLVRALAAFSERSGRDVSGRIALLRGAHFVTFMVNGVYVQSSGSVHPKSTIGLSRELLRLARMIASGVSSGGPAGRV